MANLNKVFLIGRLTRDPEVRYTPSGQAVVDFGLAVNRVFNAQNGEKREETCFVDINIWGRRGEVAKEYLRKGKQVFIEGRLNFRSWEGQDGQKRSKLSVVADTFEFLDGGGRREDRDASSAAEPEPPPTDQGTAPPARGEAATPGEDDLPF